MTQDNKGHLDYPITGCNCRYCKIRIDGVIAKLDKQKGDFGVMKCVCNNEPCICICPECEEGHHNQCPCPCACECHGSTV